MKHGRIFHDGQVVNVTEGVAGQVLLPDGQLVAESEVNWLPPTDFGTIIALGLNYADHVKELSRELTVTTKDAPLVFLKGPNSVIGHRQHTPRPVDANFMHYECELAVVIGKETKNVQAQDALQYVLGYTVCNDYAVRDYLENFYRPNLRVKNRDACTVIGPWLVDASDIADPHNLALRTRVNGVVTQSGNTSDMIHKVTDLIAYLSSFMTLSPGDVILTGTPDGVVNVHPGDVVETEIDGVGNLINTLVAA